MSILFDNKSILAKLDLNSDSVRVMKQGIKRTSYRAVINWLTKYNFDTDVSNLEKVKGLLEAFFHLCEIEDVENSWKILHCHLDTPTQECLYEQLRTWGYYQKLQDLYYHLLNKPLDDKKSAVLLDWLGIIYSSKGEYSKAICFHQKSLKMATQSPGLQVGGIYCNLSFCYFSLEGFNLAIDFAHKSLVYARRNQDERLEAKSLHHLGIAYFHLEEDDRAITHIMKAISIAEKVQADFLIPRMIGDLGSVYFHLKRYEDAYKMHKQRLDIAILRQDKPGEAIAFCNLGNLQRLTENMDEAVEYLENAVNISKEIQDKQTEAQSYYFLALIFEKMDNKVKANTELGKAHDLAQSLSSPLVKECKELKERLLNE